MVELRFDRNLDAAVDYSQGIDTYRRGGRLAFDTAIANIERGAVQGANEPICSQATALQLRPCVRALVLDGKEIILRVTDQNIVAGYLE